MNAHKRDMLQATDSTELGRETSQWEGAEMEDYAPEMAGEMEDGAGQPLEGRAKKLAKVSIGCLEMLIQMRECVVTLLWQQSNACHIVISYIFFILARACLQA